MNKKDCKIYIVGAGVAGLVAAQNLELNGYFPIILESTDRVGGRVKTDLVNGYQLDHGFQVLLTAYPAAQKYLNYEELELQKILPGAVIFKNKRTKIIGDPLRNLTLLLPTLFSGIGTVSDKVKILKLNTILKKKTVEDIFTSAEQTTQEYLKNFGFSPAIIQDFFKPFFSGIFLETKLETSSRMFEFVYKMFGEGEAAIPKAGIEAIPKQLLERLKNTKIEYNTKVASVKDGEIRLESGQTIESHFTIIATEPSKLLPNLKNQSTLWKSCDTLYFETDSKAIDKKLIGLVQKDDAIINNIFYHTCLETGYNSNKELLSVTVIDHQIPSENALIVRVKQELEELCGINVLTFLKRYEIPMALPNLTNLQYDMLPSETRITSTLFLAGDTQLNGSLNAAMISGERAALGVIEKSVGIFA